MGSSSGKDGAKSERTFALDPDHLLLLRSARPLLQSRNSAVVLSVIQLYIAVGPQHEWSAQLHRLLHSHRKIQLIILKSIVTLTSAEFNDQVLGQLRALEKQQQEKKKEDNAANNATAASTTAIGHLGDCPRLPERPPLAAQQLQQVDRRAVHCHLNETAEEDTGAGCPGDHRLDRGRVCRPQ